MFSIKSPYKVKTFLREFSQASNYNAYDLVKGIPLEFKLIEYTVDHEKKTTCLTPKALKILELNHAIEKM